MTNVIYKLINRKKEKLNQYPCYYIGSKVNYVSDKYWGSSRNSLLINEIATDLSVFDMEIIEVVENIDDIITREIYHQKNLNVMDDKKYYNLRFAGERFTSLGFKWYYDPHTLIKGYFPKNKVPNNWVIGKFPKKEIVRTGFNRGTENLKNYLSNANSIREWVVRDPFGNIYIAHKLHKFCNDHKISHKIRNKSFIGKTTKDGWSVVEVRNKTTSSGDDVE